MSGFIPQFYEVNRDLSPNVQSFHDRASKDVSAAILIHYFGFPNIALDVVNICKQLSISIIEDACHTDYRHEESNSKIGMTGDWIFSSPRKFYDIYDGGYLQSLNSSISPTLPLPSIPSVPDELRATAHYLSSIYHRFIDDFVNKGIMKAASNMQRLLSDSGIAEDGLTDYVDPRFNVSNHDTMTYCSRMILFFSKSQVNKQLRRKNYEFLAELTTPLKQCEVFHPHLPEYVSPYVYPLILTDPDDSHKKLRDMGAKILRWEDLAPSDCDTSRYYEKHLVQVPLNWQIGSAFQKHIQRVLIDVLQ
jgi:dTDP-4-amino-4,6-dideoxygalactose transaminase